MLEKVKFEGEHAYTLFAKNLFLANKKKKDQIYLVVAAHNTDIDMKALTSHFKAGSGNLRAGDQEVMETLLGVKKGGVNLFSIVNDTAKKVHLVLDSKLLEAERVGFHPMQNDATTSVSVADMNKVVELSGHTAEIIDFSKLVTEAAPAEEKKEEAKGGKGAKKAKDEGKIEDALKIGIEYTKEQNFSKWYQQVITKSEMIEYYEISGCYILRPLAYFIWESIQNFLDPRFKLNGVSNCYFPMFVSEAALSKEKAHIEGFAPEVAWVTKSGKTDLPEPIAIRPTSETIMYPSYAKWIHSHRDLPLCLNQWTNVVRWEFKHPTPFIRTREFLWQEGHTAHATTEEADDMVLSILDYYANCYKELLAVPVVKGKKSEEEKFAGAYYTTTVELYVPANGRGIQGATSHQLGQNFAKMFDVWFEDKEAKKQFAWQTSWGFSTRSIGSMIMVHGDNKGLVLPPRVAQIQVVIVPITFKDDDIATIQGKASDLAKLLKQSGVRTYCDDRENYNPGYKYNHWEQRGVPIRLELGKKDFEKQEVRVVRRDNGEKFQLKWADLAEQIPKLLDTIHNDMYNRALAIRDDHMKEAATWQEFMNALNGRNIVQTPWCNDQECEKAAKDKSKEESLKIMEEAGEEEEVLTGSAKTLCIPFEPKTPIKSGDICFHCGKEAKVKALWGRSY